LGLALNEKRIPRFVVTIETEQKLSCAKAGTLVFGQELVCHPCRKSWARNRRYLQSAREERPDGNI
jgi:hypothetical protein